jgi:hypothetical protein
LCVARAATAACAEGGGASEGRALGGPNQAAPSNTTKPSPCRMPASGAAAEHHDSSVTLTPDPERVDCSLNRRRLPSVGALEEMTQHDALVAIAGLLEEVLLAELQTSQAENFRLAHDPRLAVEMVPAARASENYASTSAPPAATAGASAPPPPARPTPQTTPSRVRRRCSLLCGRAAYGDMGGFPVLDVRLTVCGVTRAAAKEPRL